jgi:hypothetical protein
MFDFFMQEWGKKGEQPYCRNCLLEKLSKTVLGQNVENKIQNLQFGPVWYKMPNFAKQPKYNRSNVRKG